MITIPIGTVKEGTQEGTHMARTGRYLLCQGNQWESWNSGHPSKSQALSLQHSFYIRAGLLIEFVPSRFSWEFRCVMGHDSWLVSCRYWH